MDSYEKVDPEEIIAKLKKILEYIKRIKFSEGIPSLAQETVS